MIKTIEWTADNRLRLLDQTKLPIEETYIDLDTLDAVIEAIQSLRVRGAPAIGVSAAYGMVIAADSISEKNTKSYLSRLRKLADQLVAARPTAVNLSWAVESIMKDLGKETFNSTSEIGSFILQKAKTIHADDMERCHTMAEHGLSVIPKEARVLTHCNTGYLATAGIGTALGVIFRAHNKGHIKMVYANETRPLLQGARLTTWECKKMGVPHTLISDNMAGALMRQGMVDLVIVGSDRIASDGAAANKIGTYSVAVLAHHHQIPFYVAAPLSTFDMDIVSGEEIPIEDRHPDEIRRVFGKCLISSPDTPCWNPAFDVTPPHLISGIITERGLLKPPLVPSIADAFGGMD